MTIATYHVLRIVLRLIHKIILLQIFLLIGLVSFYIIARRIIPHSLDFV